MSTRAEVPERNTRSAAEERGIAWSARLGLALVWLLGLTWRFKLCNDAPWRAMMARGENMVLAVWHGDMLAPIWMHRRHGMVAMVSEHRDGEIIARIVEGLGLETSRGSTTRGGRKALLGLIRALEAGRICAFTPDGPQGPRHALQPGLLAAAKKAGVPIILIGTAVDRAWRFNSWDRFTLPKPFAKICLAYTDPTRVDAALADVASEVPRFTALIDDAEARAERELAGRWS